MWKWSVFSLTTQLVCSPLRPPTPQKAQPILPPRQAVLLEYELLPFLHYNLAPYLSLQEQEAIGKYSSVLTSRYPGTVRPKPWRTLQIVSRTIVEVNHHQQQVRVKTERAKWPPKPSRCKQGRRGQLLKMKWHLSKKPWGQTTVLLFSLSNTITRASTPVCNRNYKTPSCNYLKKNKRMVNHTGTIVSLTGFQRRVEEVCRAEQNAFSTCVVNHLLG